jgi:hypothetical protein
MKLQLGDWVRTKSGEAGKVVHTSRLTVFVAIPQPGKVDQILPKLESELTKIDPSATGGPNDTPCST